MKNPRKMHPAAQRLRLHHQATLSSLMKNPMQPAAQRLRTPQRNPEKMSKNPGKIALSGFSIIQKISADCRGMFPLGARQTRRTPAQDAAICRNLARKTDRQEPGGEAITRSSNGCGCGTGSQARAQSRSKFNSQAASPALLPVFCRVAGQSISTRRAASPTTTTPNSAKRSGPDPR